MSSAHLGAKSLAPSSMIPTLAPSSIRGARCEERTGARKRFFEESPVAHVHACTLNRPESWCIHRPRAPRPGDRPRGALCGCATASPPSPRQPSRMATWRRSRAAPCAPSGGAGVEAQARRQHGGSARAPRGPRFFNDASTATGLYEAAPFGAHIPLGAIAFYNLLLLAERHGFSNRLPC